MNIHERKGKATCTVTVGASYYIYTVVYEGNCYYRMRITVLKIFIWSDVRSEITFYASAQLSL